jgi:RNA polymerase sigma-70 factor (ECF subfamily)
MLRAWRGFDRFDERRGSLRTWLFHIATNICLDMLKGAQRRARAMDLGPSSPAGPALGAPLPEYTWVQPIPDGRVLPEDGDPAELAASRETVSLAFVAALQRLPPHQRAVLILREVLCWRASEVAGLLGITSASVNSSLQRARAALGKAAPPADPYSPLDSEQRALLTRYVDAFERYDVEALVSLLHEDATMSMPPFGWWLSGREDIRQALVGDRLHRQGRRRAGAPGRVQHRRDGRAADRTAPSRPGPQAGPHQRGLPPQRLDLHPGGRRRDARAGRRRVRRGLT